MASLGRYELVRLLSRGGMADVFLARRRVAGLEKRLVIKRLRAVRDPRQIALFVREARVSMSLMQQNIVPVFDFGRMADDAFLAMEYVDGVDVATLVTRQGPLAPWLAAHVAAECGAALHYAHQHSLPADEAWPAVQGLVHRDVTPRNILLSWQGEVRLTDFGIAAALGQAAGRGFGTPAYMAPEQARGDAVDARADVYALGLVLRELLTGQRARPGDGPAAWLEAARTGALLPLAATLPDGQPWPVAVRDVLERATAASPAARYPTALAMREALERYITEARTTAHVLPSHALASVLAPLREPLVRSADESETPEAITYLGDGLERVLAGTRDEASLAGTRDEASLTGEVSAPRAAASAHVVSAPPTRKRGITIAVGGSVVAGVIGGALAFSPRGEPRQSVGAPWPAALLSSALEQWVRRVATPAGAPAGAQPPRVAVPEARRTVRPSVMVPRLRGASPPSVPASAAPAAGGVAPRPGSTVIIGARPWAFVRVDNAGEEHETPVTLTLPHGKHVLRFRNDQLGVTLDRTIEISEPEHRIVEILAP